MNFYVTIGIVLVAIWIAVIYISAEMRRVVQINARITQEGIEEIVKQLQKTNALLKELQNIDFYIEDGKIKNTRNLYVKGWSKPVNENPFEELKKAEELIKSKRENV